MTDNPLTYMGAGFITIVLAWIGILQRQVSNFAAQETKAHIDIAVHGQRLDEMCRSTHNLAVMIQRLESKIDALQAHR